jgi:hypothetical protein
MANEITATAGLVCTKSGTTVNGTTVKVVTLTGSAQFSNTQAIGTSPELLVYPADLTAEGITWVYFKNDDATNYVEIALDNFTNVFLKLLAGQAALIRAHTGNPTHYARANTAAVNLKIVAIGT